MLKIDNDQNLKEFRKQKNLNEEPKEKKQDKLRILVVSSGALKSKKDKTPIFHTASRFKDEAKEVQHGYECGIKIEDFIDIKVNDIIETYELIEQPRKL